MVLGLRGPALQGLTKDRAVGIGTNAQALDPRLDPPGSGRKAEASLSLEPADLQGVDDEFWLGPVGIGVFDAALLVETGAHRDFHRLIVVRCSRETQIARLRERNGLSPDQAESRIAAQAPLERKLAVADYVIDTEGPLVETREQTAQVYAQLQCDFDRQFPES